MHISTCFTRLSFIQISQFEWIFMVGSYKLKIHCSLNSVNGYTDVVGARPPGTKRSTAAIRPIPKTKYHQDGIQERFCKLTAWCSKNSSVKSSVQTLLLWSKHGYWPLEMLTPAVFQLSCLVYEGFNQMDIHMKFERIVTEVLLGAQVLWFRFTVIRTLPLITLHFPNVLSLSSTLLHDWMGVLPSR